MDEERLPAERMRASDTDRDTVAERLAGALSEGRLDLSEYDERLSAAMRATTMGELARITEDLPEPAPGAKPVDPAEADGATAARNWRDRLEPWRGMAAISVILVGIWAVTSVMAGALLPFWPAWPLSFMFIFTTIGVITGSSERHRHTGGGHGGIERDRRRGLDSSD